MLHFIGVANDQFRNAVRVWGQPDHVHGRATWSLLGEIPAADKVIFGRGAFPVPGKWRGKGAHSITSSSNDGTHGPLTERKVSKNP